MSKQSARVKAAMKAATMAAMVVAAATAMGCAATRATAPEGTTLASLVPGAEPAPHACVASAPPAVIASRASIPEGLAGTRMGHDRLALAFNVSPREERVVELDSSAHTTRQWTNAADVVIDPVARTIVPSGSDVAWTGNDAAQKPRTIWHVDGGADAALELDAVATDAGYTVAVRRGEAMWVGAVDASGVALAPLAPIVGAHAVGTPSIASSGGAVLVVWEAKDNGHNAVRAVRFVPGSSDAPRVLVGTSSDDAVWPTVAGLGDGRFLLTYYAGDTEKRDLFAQTLDSNGALVGAPSVLSSASLAPLEPARIVVGADGRAVVAFFAMTGDGDLVAATPVACGE
jgi:hypothetical protein